MLRSAEVELSALAAAKNPIRRIHCISLPIWSAVSRIVSMCKPVLLGMTRTNARDSYEAKASNLKWKCG